MVDGGEGGVDETEMEPCMEKAELFAEERVVGVIDVLDDLGFASTDRKPEFGKRIASLRVSRVDVFDIIDARFVVDLGALVNIECRIVSFCAKAGGFNQRSRAGGLAAPSTIW